MLSSQTDDTAAKWVRMLGFLAGFRSFFCFRLWSESYYNGLLQQRKFQFCVVCNQKARVSEVRLVLLKAFETCCTHTLCIKGLVLATKVKISSEPLGFDLSLLCGLCWMQHVDKTAWRERRPRLKLYYCVSRDYSFNISEEFTRAAQLPMDRTEIKFRKTTTVAPSSCSRSRALRKQPIVIPSWNFRCFGMNWQIQVEVTLAPIQSRWCYECLLRKKNCHASVINYKQLDHNFLNHLRSACMK